MKRIFGLIVFGLALTMKAFPDALFDTEMSSIMKSMISNVATEMAKNMGYYTGSANVAPANTSGFLGIKFGVGGGLNMTRAFLESTINTSFTGLLTGSISSNALLFDDYAKTFAAFPFPYDLIYFKIGLPLLPADIGVRVGFIPPLSFGDANTGTAMSVGQFHFGAEARYNLLELPAGIMKVDVRLSYDYDGGFFSLINRVSRDAFTNNITLGTLDAATKFDFGWSGSSLGAKLMAGVNLPFIGSIFGGLGLNWNIGETTATARVNEGLLGLTPIDLMETIRIPYNPLDIRLIGGFNIFFVSAAVEYGLLNSNIAITFIPFQMAF